MSKRLDVLASVTALVAAAVPGAEVIGPLDEDAAARASAAGRIVVRSGDPGDPDIDLSPVTYNWAHQIPVEVIFAGDIDVSAELRVDAALVAIGAAIIADRQLGGLCDWLDAIAPSTDDLLIDGALAPRAADLVILATYSTSSPTG